MQSKGRLAGDALVSTNSLAEYENKCFFTLTFYLEIIGIHHKQCEKECREAQAPPAHLTQHSVPQDTIDMALP